MTSEKRIILFVALTFAWFVGVQYLGDALGLNPPPPPVQKRPAVAAGQPATPKPAEPKAAEPGPGQAPADAAVAEKAPAERPAVAPAEPSELVLKSDRLEVQLEQAHAGVESVVSLQYEAEFEDGKPRHRPLTLVGARENGLGPKGPPSMLVTLVPTPDGKRPSPRGRPVTRPSRSMRSPGRSCATRKAARSGPSPRRPPTRRAPRSRDERFDFASASTSSAWS